MDLIEHVEIQPIVLKIDYKPKYLNYGNLKEGQFAELVNLFHLDGADIQLSQVRLTGINGLTKLGDRLNQEWLPHIMNTQVPHMVSGVSPIRSIVNVGSGVADLVLLPIQQYRKDGRVIRGIQRGTQSFARATAMEAIKLSARFASGAQVILEHADDFFSSNVTVQEDNQQHSKFANQPSDLSQGLQIAYQSLTRNLGSAAHTIFAVPTEIVREEEESMPSTSSSSSSASDHKAVIRAVPVAVIKPMIGLTGAFQSIMVGLRNTIDPVMRLQSEDVSSHSTRACMNWRDAHCFTLFPEIQEQAKVLKLLLYSFCVLFNSSFIVRDPIYSHFNAVRTFTPSLSHRHIVSLHTHTHTHKETKHAQQK